MKKSVISALQPSLVLHPPTSPEEAPSIIDFERYREIEIDWEQLFDSVDPEIEFSQGEDDNAPLSEYEYFQDPDNGFFAYVVNSWKTYNTDEKVDHEVIFRADQNHPNEHLNHNFLGIRKSFYIEDDKAKEVQGLYFVFQPSHRRLMPCDRDGKPLITRLEKIDSNSPWVAFNSDDKPIEGTISLSWLEELLTNEMKSAKVIYDTQAQAEKSDSDSTYISRKPVLWSAQYWELKKEIELAKQIQEHAKTILTNDLAKIWDDPEKLEDSQQKYVKYTTLERKARSRLQALLKEVREHGYILATGNKKIRNPATGKLMSNVKEGELYRVSRRLFRWSTQYVVHETRSRRGSSGRRRTWRVPVVKTRYHAKLEYVWQYVPEFDDPVDNYLESIGALNETGLPEDADENANANALEKVVHEVLLTANGYFSSEGEPLRNIMKRCELDEVTRLKTVIVIKEYSPFLSNQPAYLGAYIFENPLPGILIDQFPEVSFKETLSYNIMWTGTELGQLVATIPLAPGEERTVSVSQHFSEEVSVSSSFSETNEFSSSQSTDLATAFENEASKSFEKTNKSSGSASAGFSYGGFGASAEAILDTQCAELSRQKIEGENPLSGKA